MARKSSKRNRLGVYLRPGGTVYWMQWRGKRFSLEVTDPIAADLKAAEIQRRDSDPSFAPTQKRCIEDVCTEWAEWIPTADNRDKPPAAGTLDMYGNHIGHFLRLFGGQLPIAAVDAGAIDNYVTRRRKELVPGKNTTRQVTAATVSKELGTLRQILRFAKRRRYYTRDLDEVMPQLVQGTTKRIDRALTLEQLPLFLAQLPEHHAAIACFLVGLGADRCAVPRAVLADFEERPGLVLVRGTKNSKRWAWVPVLDPFTPYVARAHAWVAAEGGFRKWRNAPRDMTAACRRAGVPRVTPRDLRRSFGEILSASGIPPALLGGLLRHADSRMAETVYGRRTPERLGELAKGAAAAAAHGLALAASTGTPEVQSAQEIAKNAE